MRLNDNDHEYEESTYTETNTICQDFPDVLNVAHLCEILGISRKLAYRLLKEGEIEYLLIGRSYRIPKVNLIKYLLKEKTKTEMEVQNFGDR